jgi:hypothetical protein
MRSDVSIAPIHAEPPKSCRSTPFAPENQRNKLSTFSKFIQDKNQEKSNLGERLTLLGTSADNARLILHQLYNKYP